MKDFICDLIAGVIVFAWPFAFIWGYYFLTGEYMEF